MRLTTEEAVVKTLQAYGVRHAFGIIGSAFMPISDLFPRAGHRLLGLRARGVGRGMMADGYTRATGRMCMVIAQNGLGIAPVTAVKTACWHTPLLLVTPQAANRAVGQGGQEVEQMGLLRDMVAYQEEVGDPARIAEALARVVGQARRLSSPARRPRQVGLRAAALLHRPRGGRARPGPDRPRRHAGPDGPRVAWRAVQAGLPTGAISGGDRAIGSPGRPAVTMVMPRDGQWGVGTRSPVPRQDDLVGTEPDAEVHQAGIALACGLGSIVARTMEGLTDALRQAVPGRMEHEQAALIEATIDRETGEPLRRDAMKKPVAVAGIQAADMA